MDPKPHTLVLNFHPSRAVFMEAPQSIEEMRAACQVPLFALKLTYVYRDKRLSTYE